MSVAMIPIRARTVWTFLIAFALTGILPVSAYLFFQKHLAPTVTRDRMYIDAMQDVYSNVTKVMVDTHGGTNLVSLPLDKLLQAGAGNAPQVASSTAAAPIVAPLFAGRVLVRSTPPGARVFVDGRSGGETQAGQEVGDVAQHGLFHWLADKASAASCKVYWPPLLVKSRFCWVIASFNWSGLPK